MAQGPKQKEGRKNQESNQGPVDLQSTALPLSYPSAVPVALSYPSGTPNEGPQTSVRRIRSSFLHALRSCQVGGADARLSTQAGA